MYYFTYITLHDNTQHTPGLPT